MAKYIYLAGPIAGCDKGEANDWRNTIASKFPSGVVGISPLRCEPLVGDKYDLVYNDPRFGTSSAIAGKNELDVRSCDLVLAYLPKELNDRRPSYGTTLEIGWAQMLNKPIILVTDDDRISKHPLFNRKCAWVLDNFDDAIAVIRGLYSDYAKAA